MSLRGLFLLGCLTSVVSTVGAGCAGCATVRPRYDYAGEPDPRTQEYVLGASDVLRITIWHNADLSAEAIVRPDGTISLPLVGDLRAAGRTPGQVRAEVARRLSTFVKDESALVTLALVAINSYRFVVSGNVEHPGVFTASHFVTVTEAMAMAGGPNRFASPEEAVLIRNDPTRGLRRIPIDYPSILNGVHPEQDLPLLPRDNLYVP